MDMTEEYEIDFKLYESGRFAVTAMFALTPEDLETERKLSQTKINDELAKHNHKKCIKIRGKSRTIGVAKAELIAHYKYAHYLIQ